MTLDELAASHPYYHTLARLHQLGLTIRNLQAEERALREQVFSGTFPTPKEGVNKLELPEGWLLKGTYKLNRKLDVKSLQKLVADGLVPAAAAKEIQRIKVELDLKAYKAMPEPIRKTCEANGVVTITPGLPELELIEPKQEE